MKTDHFYRSPLKRIKPFEFDQDVAEVFDDMVSRSVPFYHNIHQMITDILNYSFNEGDTIYDLGCSTGTTIQLLSRYLKGKKAHFIGVDNSKAMLNKAHCKLATIEHSFELRCENLQDLLLKPCGMVIMNYTLQFMPIKERLHLVEKVHQKLRPQGVFILSEKINSSIEPIDHLTTDLYYDFKRRNGYSELEISQKREALEKVLITLTPQKQVQLLQDAGFQATEMLFRWYNFASFLGIK